MGTRILATASMLGVAAVVAATCLVGVRGEYAVVTTDAAARSDLHEVSGRLLSCRNESAGLSGIQRLLHGAWGGPPTYLLTLDGIDGAYRTHAFGCGSWQGAGDADAPVMTVKFLTTENPAGVDESVPIFNAYGLVADGHEMRSAQVDLDEQRRRHDYLGPLNLLGLVLLTLVLPALIIAHATQRLWRDSDSP